MTQRGNEKECDVRGFALDERMLAAREKIAALGGVLLPAQRELLFASTDTRPDSSESFCSHAVERP